MNNDMLGFRPGAFKRILGACPSRARQDFPVGGAFAPSRRRVCPPKPWRRRKFAPLRIRSGQAFEPAAGLSAEALAKAEACAPSTSLRAGFRAGGGFVRRSLGEGGSLRPFEFAQGRLSSRRREPPATFPTVARAKVGNVPARFRGRRERRKEARAARTTLRLEAGGREAKKGTGVFCAKHPKGRSGKRLPSPFWPLKKERRHDAVLGRKTPR